jgi:ADP-dependent NAD(P)H-hydrate dehydratase / NAD(P)H-hydrate epimerase
MSHADLHWSSAARDLMIARCVVTSDQMSQIEARVFEAGMPVAALMEKVGGLLTQWLQARYPLSATQSIGVLVGPGHNGGDALVVARELHLKGYQVIRYQPFSRLKPLTQSHAQYADALGIPAVDSIEPLQPCDLIIDGLFGFGLTRPLEGDIAAAIQQVNHWGGRPPIVSIDLPSGLHTDTGEALGMAIQATHSVCLGLWKRAYMQEAALAYTGQAELIDFGLPLADIEAVLENPEIERITTATALAALPLPRAATTHKYKQGHLLLLGGSRQYMGAAILMGLAARASGVGMLSIAVPETLRPILIAQLPDALVIGCPEDQTGAIAALPDSTLQAKYDAIACGPGLTTQAAAVVEAVSACPCPLLLDADGLNILAQQGVSMLHARPATTILTPHLGEFKRLFPNLIETNADRIAAVQAAAVQSQAIVLLKGARTVIATPKGSVWINPDSTPALARGGSGDVLTGLMAGLLAQGSVQSCNLELSVLSAAWWHAQAGILAAHQRTELGVDASTLIQFLLPAIAQAMNHPIG